MEATTIVILSLAIIWIVLTIIRDEFKNKWYRKGYLDAAHKYDKFESRGYKKKTYSQEADETWHKKHGFHYD